SVHATLQLENFDFVGEGLFVGLEHADDVVAVFFLSHKQPPLYVLRFAASFNYVPVWIFLHVLDGVFAIVEFFITDDVYAGFFQLFLAEGAVVFQLIGVGTASDDLLSLGAKRGCPLALAERVVEDDDVGPVGIFVRVFGLRHKAIGDVRFFFFFNV